MELQKLIDGLKAHKSGAASYESVDEAIRVFKAMRDVDGEKVVKGLEKLDGEAYSRWVHCPYTQDVLIKGIGDYVQPAIALIRQQQERIAELEAELGQRDYNAAVEMQQYCERYEHTYNPEDGSM